jgi:hypothetical protein
MDCPIRLLPFLREMFNVVPIGNERVLSGRYWLGVLSVIAVSAGRGERGSVDTGEGDVGWSFRVSVAAVEAGFVEGFGWGMA